MQRFLLLFFVSILSLHTVYSPLKAMEEERRVNIPPRPSALAPVQNKGERHLSTSTATAAMTIQVLEKEQYGNDALLYKTIHSLAEPSYKDASVVLEKDWNHCDRLYLGYQEDKLVCFFMIGRENLSVKGKLVPAVYLGLSCTHHQTKNSGLVRQLLMHFIQDAQKWEKTSQRPLLLWYTTASASICNMVPLLFRGAQPFTDGAYLPEEEQLVHAIKEKMGWLPSSGTHAFVVKGITKVRYSPEETQRLKQIKEKHNFTLLDSLGVQEAEGDRMIGVCYLPLKAKL